MKNTITTDAASAGRASTLEKTVIELASGYLEEMEHSQKFLRADEFSTRFQKLSVLTEIAYLAGSGLSEEAVKALIDIDERATSLIARTKKTGNAINSNISFKLFLEGDKA